MTKKHFEALATALASTRPDKIEDRELWGNTVIAIADVCAQFNPAFDRTRFIGACATRTTRYTESI